MKNAYIILRNGFIFGGILWLALGCNNRTGDKPTLFRQVPSSHSGLDFSNQLTENDDFNIIEYLYFYNGGGVAVGDINNDGWEDLFFTANQQPNRLYLNKGGLRFEDITEQAGVAGTGNWKTGVAMADVNNDGLLDIYVCGVGAYKNFNGFNQLFINNGNLTFTESAEAFGLAFQGFSTHASFFDYDLDGDLDMYLLNHSVHSTRSFGKVSLRYQSDSLAGDRLYKNLYKETGRHFFEDVTKQAGIFSSQIGYGLGLAIADFNRDGYPDIYVSNDFHENDYLYINQKDGTFLQQAERSMAHASRFSMGNEAADINNDGWMDIITLDMLPRKESVIKTSAGEDSYEVYKFKLSSGFARQVSRNALQLNHGPIDSGRLVFSDIAQVAGVDATDWSWCPIATDFDGDGWKDLFVSNGIVRRPNDLDYINFMSNDSVQQNPGISDFTLADRMPAGEVSNFIFKNNGNLTFTDVTRNWGLYLPSFSNGAVAADLDNDGDPDLVVNRINEEALLYENTSDTNRFVTVTLDGSGLDGNQYAIGTRVEVTSGGYTQTQEFYPSRGWCSSSSYRLYFGSPQASDQIKIYWPNGKITEIDSPENKKIRTRYGAFADSESSHEQEAAPLLKQVEGPPFLHREDDFNAFNRESLIPHMFSTQGPPLAVADINNDGLDDVFVGGARGQAGALFLQGISGSWKKVNETLFAAHAAWEDTDASFLDADGDGDLDLVVVSGGQEEMENRKLLAPRLYENNGRGSFSYQPDAIQNVFLHASCVKPFDYDADGDVDLFVGALVMPYLYGMSPLSYLLVNNGQGKFAPDMSWLGDSSFDNPMPKRPGMVKDAAWIDVNQDGLFDLVLVGEWMPVTVLIQQPNHRFLNQTNALGLAGTKGWWNTIEVGDFDQDGDADWIVGNLGLNARLKASVEKPVTLYLGDFDSNQGSDHIIVYFNGDQSYPFASRDQLVKQIPSLKKKFLRYSDYRDVKLDDIITPVQQGNAAALSAQIFETSIFLNLKDSVSYRPLPLEAQFFPVFGAKAADLNEDGNADLLLTGNLNATQPDFGAYDAGVGLMLVGDGKGNFQALTPAAAGFITLGEGRDVEEAAAPDGKKWYLVSRNNHTVLSFQKTGNK